MKRLIRKTVRQVKRWVPVIGGCAFIGGALAIVTPDKPTSGVMNSLSSQYLEKQLGRKLTKSEKQKVQKNLSKLKFSKEHF